MYFTGVRSRRNEKQLNGGRRRQQAQILFHVFHLPFNLLVSGIRSGSQPDLFAHVGLFFQPFIRLWKMKVCKRLVESQEGCLGERKTLVQVLLFHGSAAVLGQEAGCHILLVHVSATVAFSWLLLPGNPKTYW